MMRSRSLASLRRRSEFVGTCDLADGEHMPGSRTDRFKRVDGCVLRAVARPHDLHNPVGEFEREGLPFELGGRPGAEVFLRAAEPVAKIGESRLEAWADELGFGHAGAGEQVRAEIRRGY